MMQRSGFLRAAAALAAGLLAMGAGHSPASREDKSVESAIARILPTPRLYQVTMTGPMARRGDGPEMCVGAELFRNVIRGPEQRAQAVSLLQR